jgi:hypothetical protein
MKHSPCTERANKRRAAIYRKAARGVEQNVGSGAIYGYACNAIEAVQGKVSGEIFAPWREDSDASKSFKAVFSPGHENRFGFFGEMNSDGSRDCRVVALCFMAAMVEAGDA